MYYLGRKLISGAERSAFLDGARSMLNSQQAKKIKLVRLSIKKSNRAVAVHATWARPDYPASQTFKLNLAEPSEDVTALNWVQIGAAIAAQMGNWVDQDEEFVRSCHKADAIHYDAWKTSDWYDVVQDLLDDVELQYGPYLNGKLHWRARKAFADRIEAMMLQLAAEKHQENKPRSDSKSLKKVAKEEIA